MYIMGSMVKKSCKRIVYKIPEKYRTTGSGWTKIKFGN
jgi:hypothetical protein